MVEVSCDPMTTGSAAESVAPEDAPPVTVQMDTPAANPALGSRAAPSPWSRPTLSGGPSRSGWPGSVWFWMFWHNKHVATRPALPGGPDYLERLTEAYSSTVLVDVPGYFSNRRRLCSSRPHRRHRYALPCKTDWIVESAGGDRDMAIAFGQARAAHRAETSACLCRGLVPFQAIAAFQLEI